MLYMYMLHVHARVHVGERERPARASAQVALGRQLSEAPPPCFDLVHVVEQHHILLTASAVLIPRQHY